MHHNSPEKAKSSFATLPPELYSAILGHVEDEYLQATSFALTQALPRSLIPQHHLFHSVILKQPKQVIALWKRLARPENDREASWVRQFSLRGWGVDADVFSK
jgi:hypothetical protein